MEQTGQRKPKCKLIGENGNIFHLMAVANGTLKRNGMETQAKEMCDRIWECDSYAAALSIVGEYVDIV